MSRRQTRSSRAAAAAVDAPRPRRRAAVRAAASTEVQRTAPTWTQATGMTLVGKAIDVWWQPDETFYQGIVLSYNPRRHQHKVIYLEDESVEMLELGDGPEQRAWQYGQQVEDPLVGKDLVFLRDDDDEEDEPAWFDFMRGPREKKSQKFTVTVYAKLTTEPDPEEVCSPLPEPGQEDKDHMYYRVIHLANEFLATVDLANVRYRVDTRAGEEEEEGTIDLVSPPQQRSALPSGSRRTGAKNEVDGDEPEVLEEGRAGEQEEGDDDDDKDDAYVPPAEDGAGSGDDRSDGEEEEDVQDGEKEVKADVDGRKRKAKVGREGKKVKVKSEKVSGVDESHDVEVVAKSEDTGTRGVRRFKTEANDVDEDVEMVKSPRVRGTRGDGGVKKSSERREKTVTVDAPAGVDRDPDSLVDDEKPTTKVEVNPDDSVNVSSLEDEGTKGRVKDEGSVGTQDTHDEPLDRGRSSKDKSKGKKSSSVPKGILPDDYDEEEVKTHDTASDERKLGWVAEDRKRGSSTTISQVGDYISLDTGDGKEPRKAFVEAYLPAHDEHFVAFCDSKGGNMKIRLTKTNHTLLSDEEVQELNRRQITSDEAPSNGNGNGNEQQGGKGRGKRRRNGRTRGLTETKTKKRKESKMEVIGDTAGAEVCGRCLKIAWPGSDLVYTALVLGYNTRTKQHLVVYLSDHCTEVLELKYRDWNLIAKDDEPWIAQGMVGKRLYVFWAGEYDDAKAQEQAVKLFGEDTRVPYEAYVVSYEGNRRYKILYPATEDTEIRELKVEDDDEGDQVDKEWDILEPDQVEVAGLPILCWSE